MSTPYPFVPSQTSAPTTQVVLDGQAYNLVTTWSLFGQRYYANLYALDGTLLLCTARVGSPTGIAIEALSWELGYATVVTAEPHGYAVGSISSLWIDGAVPDGYNGEYEMLATSPMELQFALQTNPGAATTFGTLEYNINLIGGVPNEAGVYFTSALLFREQAQNYETIP